MPYVKADLRVPLEFINPMPSNAGELNYAISHLVHRYITETKGGVSYANVNEAMGVLACVQAEFYRTVVAPYENTKAVEHGSVTDLDVNFFRELIATPGAMQVIRQGDGAAPHSGQPPIDVVSLADALAAALMRPRGAVPPKQVRTPKAPAAPAPDPSKGVQVTLKPGQSRVLTGPIPDPSQGIAPPVPITQRTPPRGPVTPKPGPDASPGEKALYELAEGETDEF